jgi:hypothetical protein
MTIICAYTDGKNTWLGSDTAGVANMGNSLYAAEVGSKWTIRAGWAFGMVGDDLAATMIAENADWFFGELSESKTPAALFTQRLRQKFAEYGFQPARRDDSCPNWQSSGILATAGYFWDVDGTTAYTLKPRHELFARGGAMPLGLAAAYGYQRAAGMDADPATLIDVALDAANLFDMQIRGKWTGKL